MALKIGDRVKQRTNSTGTGGVILIGSIDGFQTFSSVLASGDTTYYVIEEADKFEVGLGTFTSGSLERTVVFASSNSGNKITLGGSGIVSLTYPAERAVYVNSDLHSVISSGVVFSNNDRLVATSGSLFYNNTNLLTGSQEYSSGIATYASGQAIANEADIVTASGALRNSITSNTTSINYVSGKAITNESNIATNVTNITYVSGQAAYASGQFDGNATPTFDDINIKEYIYHNGDTNTHIRLRADQMDFVAGNITMLTLDEASNDKVIINDGGNDVNFRVESANEENLIFTDGANDKVGIGTNSPTYKLDLVGHNSLVQSSGLIVGNSGVVLASNTPNVTSNTLYNVGGDLYFNGALVNAANTYTSGVATYASGQAIENESDILALISASGTATALIASSGIASYASGQAIENEADIVYNSGIATYASGVAASQASNVTYVSGIAVDASGVAYYASGLLSDGSPSGVPFYGGDGVLKTSTNLVYNQADGKFGIGTIPTEKLDVKGTIGASGNGYKLEGNSIAKWDGSKLQLGDWNSEGYPVTIYAASNQRIVMDGDGNVGINQENPNAQLDIYNDSPAEMAMRIVAAPGQSANLQEFQNSAGDLVSAVNSVGGIEIKDVGIKLFSNGIGTSDFSYLGMTYEAVGSRYLIASETTGTGQSHRDIHIKREDGLLKVTPSGIVANPSLSTSGVLSSGVLLYDHVPASTTNRLYNDGGVLKFNGDAVDSASNTYVSGIAVYASGLAGTNESDIVTASGALRTDVTSNTNIATYASGQVLSLEVASGLANYASGNTSNISFGSNATGDILYHNGSKFIRLPIGSNTNILKVVAGKPAWSAETENVDTYTSGNATYASGQAIANEADIVTASGALRTSVTSNTNIATYASGLLSGGTASGISFYGADQVLNSDSTLVYNSGLGYLGIGTVPTHSLDVAGPINASGAGYKVSGRSIATYDHANTKLKLGDWNDENFSVSLYTGGAEESVILKSDANVGIIETNPLAQLDVKNDTSSDMAMRVKGAAGQSANLQEWQNSAGTMLAALTSVGVIENTNGVKIYASGIGTGNVSRLTTKYDSSNYYIQTETTGTGAHSDIQIKRNTTSVHVGEDHVLVTPSLSSSGLMASGLLLHSHVPASTTNALYNEGGTLKFNGSAIGGGGGGGDVTTAQLQYVSGIAVYSSGQAIENEGDILALQSASGIATSLLVASGLANYASGAINGGDISIGEYLYHNGDTDTYIRLRGDQFDFVAGNLTFLTLDESSGSSPDTVTVNGDAADIDFVVKGDNDETLIRTDAANDKVGIGTGSPAHKLDVVGHDAWVQSSGVYVGASGIIISDGDINLEQDQRIYFEADKGTWIETDAADRLRFVVGGNQMLLLDEDDDRVNIGFGNKLGVGLGNHTSPAYDLDVQGMAQISGVIVGNSGVVLANNVPNVTTNTLYNDGGTLKFNGSAIGGGDVTTAQLQYVSGIAVYSSGQAIANESDILALQSASGIATSLLAVSGTATSLVASSGIATYASGQAIANESDVVAVSGIAASRVINFGLNGGSSVPATGIKRYSVKSPYAGTITGWEIAGNTSGNVHFDIWKSTDGTRPELANSICADAKPFASGQFATNGTLTGWTTTFDKGDIFAFVIDSISGMHQVDLMLKYTENRN